MYIQADLIDFSDQDLYVYAGDFMPYSTAWLNTWVHQLTTPLMKIHNSAEFLTNHAFDDLIDLKTCSRDKHLMLPDVFRDFYNVR